MKEAFIMCVRVHFWGYSHDHFSSFPLCSMFSIFFSALSLSISITLLKWKFSINYFIERILLCSMLEMNIAWHHFRFQHSFARMQALTHLYLLLEPTDNHYIVHHILKMLNCIQNIDYLLWYCVWLVIDRISYNGFQWKILHLCKIYDELPLINWILCPHNGMQCNETKLFSPRRGIHTHCKNQFEETDKMNEQSILFTRK